MNPVGKNCCPGAKFNGSKFNQTLVDQTPVFDKRRKHNKPVQKHSGNMYRKPNYLK
jgi:hypothetical protein